MAGAVRLPTVDGGVNRRQNLRLLIPYHSPLYTLQDQCTDCLKGRSRDQLQVEGLLKEEQKERILTEMGTREEKLYVT